MGGELPAHEREVLTALWRHQQTSGGEPGAWFALVALHVRWDQAKDRMDEEDLESQVIEILDVLERKGYVSRFGVTKDGAAFPIYRMSSEGVRVLERASLPTLRPLLAQSGSRVPNGP